MKKILILMLASVFVLAACSHGNNKTEEPAQTPATTTTTTTTSGNGGGNSSGGTQTVTYMGVKEPDEEKEVGDIVFNDGSATPYTSDLVLTNKQKNSAIAIIFYKGTGLNSGYDTTTSRTLGVGLKCGIVSREWGHAMDITTVECWGYYPPFSGDRNGSDNFEQISEYLVANGYTDDTGDVQWYQPFYFAKNYKNQIIGSERKSRIKNGSIYENDWYLPSIAEMWFLYKSFDNTEDEFSINAASNLCGGDQFTGLYWSQSSDWRQLFFSSDGESCGLSTTYCPSIPTCAIREFN